MAAHRAAAVVGLLLVTGALSGCEPPGESEAQKKADKNIGGTKAPTFVCTDKAKQVTLPDRFPSALALPAGSVIIGSEARSEGRVIVYAVSPHDVKSTLHTMQQISTAGFTLSAGEVEEHDAESNWSGNGYRGRWAIREMPECTDQTSVTVLAQKQ